MSWYYLYASSALQYLPNNAALTLCLRHMVEIPAEEDTSANLGLANPCIIILSNE
jgi:hypothetical protein